MAVEQAKMRALTDALERDGKVTFKGGATIKAERRYVLTTPLGARVVVHDTPAELERAYEIASRGMKPLPQSATAEQLAARYGDKPPW